jgi:hypothetical protein
VTKPKDYAEYIQFVDYFTNVLTNRDEDDLRMIGKSTPAVVYSYADSQAVFAILPEL